MTKRYVISTANTRRRFPAMLFLCLFLILHEFNAVHWAWVVYWILLFLCIAIYYIDFNVTEEVEVNIEELLKYIEHKKND